MNNGYSLNSGQNQLHSIRYYLENEIANNPQEEVENTLNLKHARRKSLIYNNPKTEPYQISIPSYIKEVPDSVRYEQRVE